MLLAEDMGEAKTMFAGVPTMGKQLIVVTSFNAACNLSAQCLINQNVQNSSYQLRKRVFSLKRTQTIPFYIVEYSINRKSNKK